MPRESPPSAPVRPRPRLEAAGIECVRGARALFRGLDFAVEGGGALHLRGENGAGKTSLIKILCGLHPPEAGEVRWNGAPIANAAHRPDYHRELAYLGHKPALKGELTPAENLAAIAAIAAACPARAAESAEDALRQLSLRECMHLRCAALSAGQLQRVCIAALLLRAPGGVWILDEPAAALDQSGIRALESVLAGQIARGGIVIFSSHQKLALRAPLQSLRIADYQ